MENNTGIRWTSQFWKTKWSNVISPLALLQMLALVSEHNLSLSIIQSIFETWKKSYLNSLRKSHRSGERNWSPLHKIFFGGVELATHRSPIVNTEERARAYLTSSVKHVNFTKVDWVQMHKTSCNIVSTTYCLGFILVAYLCYCDLGGWLRLQLDPCTVPQNRCPGRPFRFSSYSELFKT